MQDFRPHSISEFNELQEEFPTRQNREFCCPNRECFTEQGIGPATPNHCDCPPGAHHLHEDDGNGSASAPARAWPVASRFPGDGFTLRMKALRKRASSASPLVGRHRLAVATNRQSQRRYNRSLIDMKGLEKWSPLGRQSYLEEMTAVRLRVPAGTALPWGTAQGRPRISLG